MIERIRTIGDHLGEEIVLTLQTGPTAMSTDRCSWPGCPIRARSPGLSRTRSRDGTAIRRGAGHPVIEGPAVRRWRRATRNAEVYFWAQGDVLAMTPSHDTAVEARRRAAGTRKREAGQRRLPRGAQRPLPRRRGVGRRREHPASDADGREEPRGAGRDGPARPRAPDRRAQAGRRLDRATASS